MVRRISALFLLLFVVSGFTEDAIIGDPNSFGRLEFIYPDAKFVVHVDDIVVESTDGLKSITDINPGKHLLQVYIIKEFQKKELISEKYLVIPGGHLVRATLNDGKVSVIETMPLLENTPINAANAPQEKAEDALIASKTTSTTSKKVTTNENAAMSTGMSVDLNGDKASVVTKIPGMTNSINSGVTVTEKTTVISTNATSLTELELATPTPTIRLSRIVVMSEEGNCEIYLDGQKKLELGFGDIDEMAMGKIYDVKPGIYLLKIEGFEVWYDGKLDVGPGEVVKIRTEPGKMEIVSRITQP